MIFYIDASAVVAVVGSEAASPAVDRVILDPDSLVLISDLVVAESSAALARNGRVKRLTPPEMEQVFRELDGWAAGSAQAARIASSDITDADAFVRLPGLALRAPDAIHIAAARRLDAALLTLDHGMALAAALLGVSCINPAETSAL